MTTMILRNDNKHGHAEKSSSWDHVIMKIIDTIWTMVEMLTEIVKTKHHLNHYSVHGSIGVHVVHGHITKELDVSA